MAATAAALVTLLVGCGTQQADDVSSVSAGRGDSSSESGARGAQPVRSALAELPTAPTEGLAKGLRLPLEQYRTTPVEAYAWQVAVQQQWRSCMARFGVDDFGPPPVAEAMVEAQANAVTGRRYGISSMEQAKKYGYHLPNDVPEPPHWEPEPGIETALFTGSGPEIVDGTHDGEALPDGGCRGETAAMFPAPRTPEADALDTAVFEQSKNGDVVAAAVGAWSACMKVAGFDRSHPLEDLGAAGIQMSSATAGDEEIAQAVADVACKEETRLVDIWSTEERSRQQEAIKRGSPVLAREKALKDRNASRVRQAYETAAQR
ncbi:hypothetical protein [Streptomyces sp. TRM75563]|uniref:hypothetical protein n=1 Tax=Streptomyces sp. TRM75563 TaxID=2817418 RepID=UPI001F62012B|nr:hypothetical protein [Streptomyces sp. TRM75563]MCI4045810.1 hypothetical protein [Streptomyces sp. TRM75563]